FAARVTSQQWRTQQPTTGIGDCGTGHSLPISHFAASCRPSLSLHRLTQQPDAMVAKDRVYNYRYEGEARDARSAEYRFVKYFLLLVMLLYLLSSIWIVVFIFQQADW